MISHHLFIFLFLSISASMKNYNRERIKDGKNDDYYWTWDMDFIIAILASWFWMPSNYYSAWYFLSFWLTIVLYYYWNMIYISLLIIILLLVLIEWFRRTHYWMDPSIVILGNGTTMDVSMTNFGIFGYQTEEDARMAACHYHQHPTTDTTSSRNLNTCCNWYFTIFPSVQSALQYATATNKYDTAVEWEELKSLPHIWTLPSDSNQEKQQRKNPIYTNIRFPFTECWLPSLVPFYNNNNPTGVYRTTLTLQKNKKYKLTCHGILGGASWMYINQKMIGYWTDDHLSASFTYTSETDKVQLILVNALWGAASYVQDQDQWWMAGMNTKLTLTEGSMILTNYQIQATQDKQISVKIKITHTAAVTVEAKLYQDVQSHPHGGCQLGPLLWSTVSTMNNSTSIYLQSQKHLPVNLWNAETPHLYTCVLLVKNIEDNTILQVESCRIGFRSIDITMNGQLTLNNEPITICGVNRHEFHPTTGKIMTLPIILQDMSLLK